MLFIILFLIVDHDNDVPVVQVLILSAGATGQMRFVMTESRYKNNNRDCAKYATETDGAIIG